MQRNDERENQLEIDVAIVKFIIIAVIIDIVFFSYFWLFYQ